MPTSLTLKNIPESLYNRLKEVALANRRSMNSEILACLENQLLCPPMGAEDKLSRARAIRKSLGGQRFKAAEITKAVRESRS